MSAAILDGSALAGKIRQSLSPRVEAFKKTQGRPPGLAVVTAGTDPAANSYLNAKLKACRESGLEARVHSLSAWASQKEAAALLERLGREEAVDGVIVELPLPKHMDASAVLSSVPPDKDAEGIHPANYGRLFSAKTYEEIESRRLMAPPTALAVIELLRETKVPLAGKRAAVLGRSQIVGRPVAHLLSALNLTVTLCHSQTRDLAEELRRSEVVVSAMGKARFVKAAWLGKDAIVIDAGVNQDGDSICGDVDFDEAREVASRITPVPGGVGPVTTAMLLANTVRLAESRAGAS